MEDNHEFLRKDTILVYSNKDTNDLFKEVQKLIGDKKSRKRKSNPYYWSEYKTTRLEKLIHFIKKFFKIKNKPVTITINKSSYGK